MQLPAPFLCLCRKFRIGSSTCRVFQLQNIAVLYIWITLLVRQKEKVTVTIIHLQLRLYQIIGSECQIGLEETLQVSFPFHSVTYRGILMISTDYGLKERFPMTVVNQIVYLVFQMRKI